MLDDIDRLRDAFESAGYTYGNVVGLLGPTAHAALGRGDTRPALRVTTGGSPLETLVRLFLLGTTEPANAVRSLPREVLEPDGDGYRATVDVRPYAADDREWWVVSDLGSDVRPLRPDHVLGVGGASTTLAQATVRTPVDRALDVGTGCGVQALHLSTHAARVTATDRNPRALAFAAATARLNGLTWDLREGDLLEPVRDSRFDLLVANPPFVVGPPRDEYAYRDSGLGGDAVSERLVRECTSVLTERGTAQLLANWLHVRGRDWRERVASWLPAGVDALVLQREVQDPAEYVALWQRDAGDTDPRRYDDWLRWFEDNDVEAVGFGIVTIRDGGSRVSIEDARQPVRQPLGPHLARWLDVDTTDLLDRRPRVAPGVTLEQTAVANDGWEVASQVLAQAHGLRWRTEVDPVGVALVGACDGTRTVRELLAVLGAAYEIDAEAAVSAVRHLVEKGFLDL